MILQYARPRLPVLVCVVRYNFYMDIKSGINTAILLASLGMIVSLGIGVQSLRSGRKLLYFRLRQQRVSYGWRMIGAALGLAVLVFFLSRFGEPLVYSIYEPSPTPSLIPTITLSRASAGCWRRKKWEPRC